MIRKIHTPLYPLLALSVAALAAPAAHAQVEPYVGAGYGQYKLEFDTDDVDTEFDDDQNATRIFAGAQFTESLGAEISLYEFDDASDIGIDSDLEAASVAGIISAPLHDRFSLFAKVGWFFWEADVETTVAGAPILSEDYEGDDAFFGAGAKLGLTEAIDLRVEYDRFELEDDIEPELDYASVSLQVNF